MNMNIVCIQYLLYENIHAIFYIINVLYIYIYILLYIEIKKKLKSISVNYLVFNTEFQLKFPNI